MAVNRLCRTSFEGELMRKINCDILIIGSGAAGAVLAATLSESTDLKIVMAEKGGYYTKSFFNQREWDMRVLYSDEGARSNDNGSIPVRGGECVGGGTTVNIALCFDPMQSVWENWKREYGLRQFSFSGQMDDYGIQGLNIPNCLLDIRHRLNVHSSIEDDINDNSRIFEKGCDLFGISSRRFDLNMRDCLGCGYCPQGCSYDRKQGTMITYVEDALKQGVQLIHHFDINKIKYERSGSNYKAIGVKGRVRPTQKGSIQNSYSSGNLEINTKLTIVCAGAIESPLLLIRSGHPDPHKILGKGLVLHPSLPIIGVMENKIVNYRGISGSVYSDHFYESHGFYFECLFGHPVYGAGILPGIGVDHFELMLQYQKMAGFGVMLIDSVNLENSVKWEAASQKKRISYRLTSSDKTRLRFAAEKGVELMFAAGAREVILPSEEPIGPLSYPRFKKIKEAVFCRDLQFLPHQTTITSSHSQATVKMGEDPKISMINSRGESHFVENLLICDSSAFPSSCGVNPMISIMTLARYQGQRIANELGRYNL